MELKYILDKYGNFAIFSPVNTHADMAGGFYQKLVSAGFCNIKVGYAMGDTPYVDVHCWGSSVSLNLNSREEDEKIITKKLNNPYE